MVAALTLGQALARRLETDLDHRTGLFNRGGLEAALPRIKSPTASLLLLDIDRLQSVNHAFRDFCHSHFILCRHRVVTAR